MSEPLIGIDAGEYIQAFLADPASAKAYAEAEKRLKEDPGAWSAVKA